MSKPQGASSSAGLGGAQAAAGSNSSDGAVSKFSGQPGALTALRIDYTTRDKAFTGHPPSSELGKIREQVKTLASGPRLGDKPLWSLSNSTAPLTGIGYTGGTVGSVHFAPPSSSLTTSVPGLPQRPLMSQNSAYQAVKLNYNFRADALPPVKEVLYIPKSSKLEVDKTVFLANEAAKAGKAVIIVDKCLTTSSGLSRTEHQNTFEGKRDGTVRPLFDTYGDHNVKRHMRMYKPNEDPSASSRSRNNKNDDTSLLDSFGEGNVANGELTMPGGYPEERTIESLGMDKSVPLTLREKRDIADFYAHMASEHEKQTREAGWNISNDLEKDRSNVYKLREYKDYRALNKQKEGTIFLRSGDDSRHERKTIANGQINGGGGVNLVDPDVPITIDVEAELTAAKEREREAKRKQRGVYTAPIERQMKIINVTRSEKISKRLSANDGSSNHVPSQHSASPLLSPSIDNVGSRRRGERAAKGKSSSNGEKVFKMSNKDEWWSAVPPELESFRTKMSVSHGKPLPSTSSPEGGVGPSAHSLSAGSDSSDTDD